MVEFLTRLMVVAVAFVLILGFAIVVGYIAYLWAERGIWWPGAGMILLIVLWAWSKA